MDKTEAVETEGAQGKDNKPDQKNLEGLEVHYATTKIYETLKMYLNLNSQKDDNKYLLYKRKMVDSEQYFKNQKIVYKDSVSI